MHRTLRPVLALVVAGVLLLSACGSDDDGDDASGSTTTEASGGGGEVSETADQDYCEAAIATDGASDEERRELLDQQIETAPDELKADLELLKENEDALFEDPNDLPDEAAAALQNVLAYQTAQCGIDIGLGGG